MEIPETSINDNLSIFPCRLCNPKINHNMSPIFFSLSWYILLWPIPNCTSSIYQSVFYQAHMKECNWGARMPLADGNTTNGVNVACLFLHGVWYFVTFHFLFSAGKDGAYCLENIGGGVCLNKTDINWSNHFVSPVSLQHLPPIVLDGQRILIVKIAKNLGVYFDNVVLGETCSLGSKGNVLFSPQHVVQVPKRVFYSLKILVLCRFRKSFNWWNHWFFTFSTLPML